MAINQSRRVPEESAATIQEITAAIETLTTSDWARVKRIADYCMWRLGLKAEGRTGDDLMQTALTDLLADTRRWNRSKVGFVTFLAGAMKSISSNWARSFKKEEALVYETDLRQENENGDISSPLDSMKEQTPSPVERLHNKQTLEQIDDLFKDDEQAQMVLTAWLERFDPAGVRELWNLSQKEYNAIVRRIRRHLAAAGITPDRYTGRTNAE